MRRIVHENSVGCQRAATRLRTLLVCVAVLVVSLPSRADVTTFVTTNLSTFNVGTLSGEDGQLLNVTNAATITQLTSGAVLVGSGATGAGGGGGNTVIISNALLTASSASFIGGGSSNNSVLLLANSVWNLGDKVLTIGNSSGAVNNNLTVLGGTLTNLGGLTIGGAANANFNSLIVTGQDNLSMSAGAINVGAPVTYSQGTNLGGNNNTLILSNVVMNAPAYHVNGDGLDVGYGSSSNTVTILANTTLNLDGNGVLIGGYSGPMGTGNVLNVTGGILTNINQFYLNLAGVSNQMVVSQGGQVWVDQNVWVGGSSRTNLGNQIIVTGPGSALYQTYAGGNINIGANGTNDQANYNSFIVSNGASVVASGTTYVGEEGSNNFILVTGTGSVWQTSSINVGNGFGSSNSLTIANGARVVNKTGYIGVNLDGTGGGTNQVLVTGYGSVWSNYFTAGGGNAYSFYVGYNSSGNSLVISNGGLVYSSAAAGYPNINSIGDQAGANNNLVLVTGSGSIWTNALGTVYIGNGGANNSLTVANTGTVFSSTIIVGNASSGNNLTVARGGIINVGTSLLAGDQTGANSNTVIVTDPNSILQINGNNSVIDGIGNAASSVGNQLIVSNGGSVVKNFGSFYVGNGAGANSNTVIVTGSGSVFSNNSILGMIIGATGASYNSLTVTNGGFLFNANGGLVVGSGSGANNNAVLVSGGGVLDSLITTIGSGGNGNTLTVTDPGSVLSNTAGFNIGSGGGFNSVIVTNSGVLVSGSTLVVGNSGGSNNALLVTAGGFLNAAALTLGNGGNNNTALFTNSVLTISGGTLVGYGGSNNTLTILANTVWNNNGSGLTIGYGAAASNTVNITSLTLTNLGALVIGNSAGSVGNQLVVNQGGVVSNLSSLVLGAVAGANGNGLLITNGGLFADTGLTIGNAAGANGNFVTVTGSGSVWTNSGVVNAGGPGSSNALTVANSGAVFAPALNIGVTGSNNTVLVTDLGSTLQISGGIVLGSNATSYGNQLIVSNGASLFSASLTVGTPGAGSNSVTFNNANVVTGAPLIGNGSSNNTVSVLGNTVWNLNGQIITIGNGAASGNALTLTGGIISNSGTVTIGSGRTGANATGNLLAIANGVQLLTPGITVGVVTGDNNNAVQVLGGSVLEANSLVIAAGTTGNTISNRNSTYQFTTGAPTVISGAVGSIAINNGTISFLGIDNADVTANQGNGALSGISFAGANTFTLNASSNINVSGGVDQTYTFQAISGNPSNYVNLVMVNGQTEYGNGNLTIGASGTLLISNTTAGIDEDFLNQGTASVVNATVNFATSLVNHGLLTLQNATLNNPNSTANNSATGTIHGNGTINSDVTSVGTISPVGTLTFSGNLTLLSSSVVIMELTGYGNGVGTNDVLNVGGTFQYGGKLVVTNTTGFAYAYGQEFYLFNFASGDQINDFSVTNLPNLTPYGLAWNTSQLDTIGALIVVPEPSAALLLALGALVVWFLCRRRAATQPNQ